MLPHPGQTVGLVLMRLPSYFLAGKESSQVAFVPPLFCKGSVLRGGRPELAEGGRGGGTEGGGGLKCEPSSRNGRIDGRTDGRTDGSARSFSSIGFQSAPLWSRRRGFLGAAVALVPCSG